MHFKIDPAKKFTLADLKNILEKDLKLELSETAKNEIVKCREYIDKKIDGTKAIYGINTGFGSLCNVSIPQNDLEQLQENLVRSHSCGFGSEVPEEIVRVMILLKIQSLSYGKSGVSIETVQRLIFLFNEKIFPVIYTQGSLGASGDLAPLAHLSLSLLGEGEVNYRGKKTNTAEVYSALNLKPIKLKSKEGLALLNGTQFMSAYGCWCCLKAMDLSTKADYIGTLSLEAFDGRIDPFKSHLHTIRPHKGQMKTAATIYQLLQGSDIIQGEKKHVQDPYSFRCMPQVHGASKDVIDYCIQTMETEINSVTDNPTVFPEHDEILSGGNFHGQPLALALDFLAIALSELGSISERRTYLLISGQRELPPFLISKSGLNSGFMIPQYTAAGIASQNKQLCTPASADSIVSSNGQEDHVSMGANAATKCYQVTENLHRILAIELLNAAQALEFRRPKKSSKIIESLHAEFRKKISFLENDKILHDEMVKSASFIDEWKL